MSHDRSMQHSTYSRVLVGGAISGILVTTIVHPLDLVKVRMQLYPGKVTTEAMAKKILRCEGLSAVYSGLTAAYLRQATFTTTKLAIYYGWHERYFQKHGILPGLADKMNIGLYSGLMGGLAGNPSEVALIRMMADGRRDPCSVREHSKLYKGVFHALYKIATTEGFCSLWRGGTLTVTRSACVSVVQIGSYTKARLVMAEQEWAQQESDAKLHTYAAFISGFLTALITLPVDTIKTKYDLYLCYQIRSDGMTQKQVFLETVRENGVLYFWQGFFPYFMRLSLHTTLTFFVLQEVGVLFKIFGVFQECE